MEKTNSHKHRKECYMYHNAFVSTGAVTAHLWIQLSFTDTYQGLSSFGELLVLRGGKGHSLSLEVSQDVQDGVQLQTESLQLSALVLSESPPALHLRLLTGLWSFPGASYHLESEDGTVVEVSWCLRVG